MDNIAPGVIYILLAAVSASVVMFQLVGDRRRRRLTGDLVFMAAAMLCWQICATLMAWLSEPEAVAVLRDLCFSFASFATLGALLYTIRFYSLENYHTPSTVFVLGILPAITMALSFVREGQGFLRTASGGYGVWFWVQLAYNLILLIVSIIVAISQFSGMPRFYHNSTRILLIALALVIIGVLLEISPIPHGNFSPALIGASVSFIMLYLSSRYNLGLDYLIHARDEIFNELDEAIFITDSEGNVINRNLAARYLLFAAGIDVDEPRFSTIVDSIFSGASSSVLLDRERNGIDYEIQTSEGMMVYNVREKPIIDRRGDDIGTMVICTDVTEDHATIDRIETYAGLDPMTGLLNRGMLNVKLREMEEQSRWPVTVVICDLDNLKGVNDSKGHTQGDLVIRAAADLLVAVSPPSAYVFRIGGDEFLVLVPHMDRRQAALLIEQIQRRVAATHNSAVPLSMSVGAAIQKRGKADWYAIIDQADRHMYSEKKVADESEESVPVK